MCSTVATYDRRVTTAPASDQRIDAIVNRLDLDDWLARWRDMQGAEDRARHLTCVASMIPFEPTQAIDVLDLCAGPGDLGRTVRARFPNARVDFADRDPFLLGLCRAVEAREGASSRMLRADLWDPTWHRAARTRYHAITLANALHWLSDARLDALFRELRERLVPGGVFAFLEPMSPVPHLATEHAAWVEAHRPAETTYYNHGWDAFWSRLRDEVGFDWFTEVTAHLPAGEAWTDQHGLHVVSFLDRLRAAGFRHVDVVARDAWSAVIVGVA